MPDRKLKNKNDERTRTKPKERKRQEEPEDATKSGEVDSEVKNGTRSAPSRQQDLFRFYKKRARDRDNLAHTTERAEANMELRASDNVSMNSESGEVSAKDNGLRMNLASSTSAVINDNATLLGTSQNSEKMPKACTDISHTSYPSHQEDACAHLNLHNSPIPNSLSNASSIPPIVNVSEVIATGECVNQSTDEGSIDQGQSNTSTAPSITLCKPINQEIPTQCAALSQLPLLSHTPQNWHLPFLPDGSSSRPSQQSLFLTTDPHTNNSTSTSIIGNDRNGETRAEDALKKSGIVGDSVWSSRAIGRRRVPEEKVFSKQATLDLSNSHYGTAMASSVPESVSEDAQPVEQASEHGSEKEMRCDRLGSEEASEPICTASQNVNANEPGVEDFNSAKSIHIPDRFMEGGDSFVTPIDLTTSPRPEHGPLTNIAKSPRTRPRLTTLSGTIASRGRTPSPSLGSQEKPIEVEVLSPAKFTGETLTQSQSKLSSNKAAIRKSQQNPLQIHPFFQRTTTAATLASRESDRDFGLARTLEISSTGHANQSLGSAKSASFRADVRKAKGNKDKSSDEVQCDITGVGTDVIFTRLTSEKTRFWDFISKSTNSASSSNAIRTTVASPSSVPSKTRLPLAPWPNSRNQPVSKFQKLITKPSPFPKCVARLRGADQTGIERSLAEQLGLNRKHNPPDEGLLLAWSSLNIPSRSSIRDALKTIPTEHQEHPGISRVISEIKKKGKERGAEEDADTPRGHGLWTTKWKPRRAAEVLGNESQALYLREWLKALSIQSLTAEKAKPWEEEENVENKKHRRKRKVEEQNQKRRVVIRSIEKRKRRRIESDEDYDEGTNWIVADDEEDEIDGGAGGDADDWLPHAGKSPGDDRNDHEDFEKEFSRRLTNTILIAGKSGTGKTSAVYACATELGWEIFEVYPGIGKRAGMNLAELVGSVGQNHIVGKGIRQSVILLEEVDILFKEDINFWTSVVNIISTSHRPVILTCNDASIIPQDLLPLQKCLRFETCPCGLALSFLQAVCIAEGYDVTRNRVEEEYALTGGDEPEWPASVAFPSEALPSADLRSALNRLQMGLRFPVSQEEVFGTYMEWSAEGHTLKDCELYSESASYVNAYLDQIEQKLGFETQGDDEIGYTRLTNPEEYAVAGMQKTDFNNYSMACDALAWCCHVVNVPSNKSKTTQTQRKHHWLIQTRRLLARQAASFLDEIISLPGPLLPRHEAVLEYIPAVRWLVALDDAQDVPPHSATASRRRWRHVRYMDLGQEALNAVREYYDMFFPRCIT